MLTNNRRWGLLNNSWEFTTNKKFNAVIWSINTYYFSGRDLFITTFQTINWTSFYNEKNIGTQHDLRMKKGRFKGVVFKLSNGQMGSSWVTQNDNNPCAHSNFCNWEAHRQNICQIKWVKNCNELGSTLNF